MTQDKANGARTWRAVALVAGMTLAATGCSQEVIFEGLREELRSAPYDIDDPAAVSDAAATAAEAGVVENLSRPVNLGPAQNVASWTHRGSSAAHLPPHASLSAQPQVVWSVDIGKGNSRSNQITAEPVAAGGRIFAMDADAGVTAVSTGGEKLWTLDTTPPAERAGAGMGGGLALGEGKLFATTTFGELLAIDPASGKVLWRQAFDAPVNGAPTVSGGKVFVATATSEGYAINAATGRIDWRLRGTPSQQGVSGVASAAIAGNQVLFPMANGSLLGVEATSGDLKWVARIAGDRPGQALSVLQGFGGEPVISGGTAYVATPAGQAAAVGTDGSLRWNVDEGALGAMTVAGGSVFFVNEQNKLVRLSASDGDRVWAVDLPRYTRDNPRRIKSVMPAFGPVMAGGRLWVASGDGILRGFNPADGALTASIELGAGAAARPIPLAGGLMVLTDKGRLLALR